ncbi:MAG: hypothetical protein WCP03_02580 [Candidatus Saccharibacteria bacterium]
MIKYIVLLLITAGTLIVTLGLTKPDSNNIAIYLAIFGLTYALSAQIVHLIVKVAYPKIAKSNKLFISIVLAFTPVMLLALSTLNSAKLIDIVLSIGVPVAIVWYGIKQGLGR